MGQLSNQAALELTREGFGKMYCLAGIGGQLKGFVQLSDEDVHKVKDAVRSACGGQQPAAALSAAPAKAGCCR